MASNEVVAVSSEGFKEVVAKLDIPKGSPKMEFDTLATICSTSKVRGGYCEDPAAP